MTLEELSQLYDLKKEVKKDEKRLKILEEDAVSLSSPVVTDMPQYHSNVSRTEISSEKIDQLCSIIQDKKNRCLDEQIKLETYIASIDNSHIRRIFTLRFVDGYSWGRVAREVGGNNTIDSVKKTCYRYIKKNKSCPYCPENM